MYSSEASRSANPASVHPFVIRQNRNLIFEISGVWRRTLQGPRLPFTGIMNVTATGAFVLDCIGKNFVPSWQYSIAGQSTIWALSRNPLAKKTVPNDKCQENTPTDHRMRSPIERIELTGEHEKCCD